MGNQDRERGREAEAEAEKAPDLVSQMSERQRLQVEVIEALIAAPDREVSINDSVNSLIDIKIDH